MRRLRRPPRLISFKFLGFMVGGLKRSLVPTMAAECRDRNIATCIGSVCVRGEVVPDALPLPEHNLSSRRAVIRKDDMVSYF